MSRMTEALFPGERLIWEGRPWRGLRLVWDDLFFIPWSLVIGAVLAFVGSVGLAGLTGGEFPLLGAAIALIFSATAVYLTVGRFLHDIWIRSRTRYGLTNRRAVIVRGPNLIAVPLEGIRELELRGGKDGRRGTIQFGRDRWFNRSLFELRLHHILPSLRPAPQFYGIKQARWVFDQILIAKGETPPSS